MVSYVTNQIKITSKKENGIYSSMDNCFFGIKTNSRQVE